MSSKARFKPIGTYEGSVGYGDDWLYKVSGAGMLFKLKFQTLATLKSVMYILSPQMKRLPFWWHRGRV